MTLTAYEVLQQLSGMVFGLENVDRYFFSHLVEIAAGKATSLDKIAFYLGGEWEGVSQMSYQSRDEDRILTKNGNDITADIKPHDIIIELGPGDYKKTKRLLDTVQERKVTYFAVDCDHASLQKDIPELAKRYPGIVCIGICATFDMALDCFKCIRAGNTHIWSFGSSLSNGPREQIVHRIQEWTKIGTLWFGQDETTDMAKIEGLYQTEAFQRFLDGGRFYANGVIGWDLLGASRWTQSHVFQTTANSSCYKEILTAKDDIKGIKRGSKLVLFSAYKYSKAHLISMAAEARAVMTNAYKCNGAGIYQFKQLSAAVSHCG